VAESLQLLLVEDSEDDAILVQRELHRGGFVFACRRVDTPESLDEALHDQSWDVIITDHNLPRFSSAEVLERVREACLECPVIIVSGTIGEEAAVSAMKAGAHDYIMKDNLARLAPAVSRELREAKSRQAHRRAEEAIRHMAMHDALTGLANRRELQERIERALVSARQGAHHALLYLDLDQFKVVNDTCGHTAGDELLQQLAVSLKDLIRDTDTLARLGGDEFGVLLVNCPLERAREVGERMLQLVRGFRYVWRNKSFTLGASIGLVVIEGSGQTFSDVLRAADLACYAAKDKGRNRMHIYTPDDTELRRRHGEMEWIAHLNRALQEGSFNLHTQPIVSLRKGARLNHAREFLLRLHGSNGEVISPGNFIPAAERYNLMPAIDRWVMRRALNMLRLSRQHGAAPAKEMCFINLSATTLTDSEFCSELRMELRRTRVPPDTLCFEITETAAVANLAAALSFIQEAKSLGCRIALDDFGAGHSSFSFLKTIPADIIKIDGAFVRGMLDDPMDEAIVECIQRIGHVAGLTVVAEWVENERILDRLHEMGIDYAQGYALGRPRPLILH